jgi:hypothetical protein
MQPEEVVVMSRKTFSRTVGAVFTLVAIGHLLRIAFGASLVIQSTSIPMWVSWVAFIVAGFLAYEGFRLGQGSLPRV